MSGAFGVVWARKRMPGSRSFAGGCVVSILTGLAHAGAHFAGRYPPESPEEADLLRLMTTYVLPRLGRTTDELMTGFSWWFALGMVAPAVMSLALRRGRAGDAGLLRTLSAWHCALLGAGLAISLKYFFSIPSVMIGAALACFAVSAVRASSSTVPSPGGLA